MTAGIYCGIVCHVPENPFTSSQTVQIWEKGALCIDEHGKVEAAGPRELILGNHPDLPRFHYPDSWLIPGLIDGHIHFPQFYATAAHGEQLLDWLQSSIFPSEAKFAEPEYAQKAAGAFVDHLLSRGTTTALVFASQFLQATDALFAAAQSKGLRLIAGLTLMDRDSPRELWTSPDRAYIQCEQLIRKYGDHPRLDYAITPRFALSCSPALFEVCQSLKKAYPAAYIQTHINENLDEIAAVKAQFPTHDDYLDVYDHWQLLTPKTVLAHGIHSTEAELARIRERGCAICHCPASNLYLGSGLFSLEKHLRHRIPVLVGTDVGAGSHFSILSELSYVYKVQQMKRFSLNVSQLLYLGTLAGAEALQMADRCGNFQPGKDGDFLILSLGGDDYLSTRLEHCNRLEDQLFVLLNLADERHIKRVYVAGRQVSPGLNEP